MKSYQRIKAHLVTGIVILFIASGCHQNKDCLSNPEGRIKIENQLKSEVFQNVDTAQITVTRSITISKGTFTTYNADTVSSQAADNAVAIASRIFSSAEFQNKVIKLDFKYENHCQKCRTNADPREERIPGKVILDSIFRNRSVTINLIMNEGVCHGALGSTCPNYVKITSNYKAIRCNMPKLPFEYAYAVNICHEYMHIVGYCHTDYVDDVAEKIGWVAYYIVVDWLRT